MHGKIIKFKGDISDFKVKDGVVKIQLAADTQDVVLDQLNEISKGPLMINLETSQTELLPEEANNNANSKLVVYCFDRKLLVLRFNQKC